MNERIRSLENIVKDLDVSIAAAASEEAKEFLRRQRSALFIELQGERGAAGLNPDTGAAA